MTYTFYKYQGTGNDFVMMDNRQEFFDKNNTKLVKNLCDRRFGIGADGLILFENHSSADFKMTYFNADGNESSMCGNGGRCITAFAQHLGVIDNEASFVAIDGLHRSIIENNVVKLKMQDVEKIESHSNHVFLDTGSPHRIQFQKKLKNFNVKAEGAKIRYSHLYEKAGVNVNFVEKIDDTNFYVRTYERGVEDETLSCGTGVTAVALAMHYLGETNSSLVTLKTKGGDLKVSFTCENDSYNDIWLIGPAIFVYKGEFIW